MVVQDDKRPCTCGCNCSCECHDNVSDKACVSTHILGSTDNSIDLWVSTPAETKWLFVEEEEVKDERTRAD